MSYSVIVTAYNEEDILPDCLESINSQTVQPFFKVLIDDGSTDRTPVVAKEHGFHAQTVAWAKLKEGYKNRCRAFNIGITALYANKAPEYALKVDSDIRIPLDYAERLLRGMRNPAVGVASGVSEAYTNTRIVSNGAVMYRFKQLNYAPVIYGWDRQAALNIVRKGFNMYIDSALKYREVRPPRVTAPPLWRVAWNRVEMVLALRGRSVIVV